ncbi:hypothetical protein Btru_030454 [Bulinus truncatus]|nr:hypothetical protein Btru_030454 [Bulinus truncatus]
MTVVGILVWAACQWWSEQCSAQEFDATDFNFNKHRVAPILTPLPLDYKYVKFTSKLDHEDESDVMRSTSSSIISHFNPFGRLLKRFRQWCRETHRSCRGRGDNLDILKNPKSVTGTNLLLKCDEDFSQHARVLHLLQVDETVMKKLKEPVT